jgi:hypothetical protein
MKISLPPSFWQHFVVLLDPLRPHSLPDPACTLPSTSLSLTRRGNPQWPRHASAWPRPRSLLHHLSLVALAWSSVRARHHMPRRRTCDAALDPPTLHRRRPAALSFRRTPGRLPPRRVTPLCPAARRARRSKTVTTPLWSSDAAHLAESPAAASFPVGAQTGCTVHRSEPNK